MSDSISVHMSDEELSKKSGVRIWVNSFSDESFDAIKLISLLSTDEVDRAHSIVAEKHRKNFIIARAILRKILSNLTQIPSKAIEFAYSKFGKPSLSYSMNSSIEFSVSHTDDFFVIAAAEGMPLGIDCEVLNQNFDIYALLEDVFNPHDISKLLMLNKELQISAFYEAWTTIEAYLKAVGLGFSVQPKNVKIFEKFGGVTSEAGFLNSQKSIWHFRRFNFQKNHVGTLVFPHPGVSIAFE